MNIVSLVARSKRRAHFNHPRFRQLVRHLHGLGPRPMAEFLVEIGVDESHLFDRLEAYGRINGDMMRAARIGAGMATAGEIVAASLNHTDEVRGG